MQLTQVPWLVGFYGYAITRIVLDNPSDDYLDTDRYRSRSRAHDQ